MRLTDTLGGGYRIQMGISKVWKPVVYQIFSIWASSYFLLGGCPLSVALFTAGYANGYGRGWYLLFMAGSLFLRVPVLTALRYSFAMGVVLLVGEWTGRRKSCRDKWVLSLAGAMAVLGLFFVLSYMKGTLIQDYGNILVQAGIIFAVSEAARRILACVPEREWAEEVDNWNQQVQVKEQLLVLSESLTRLSRDIRILKEKEQVMGSRQELIWRGKFAEYRLASAEQLEETAGLIQTVVDEAYNSQDKTIFYGDILKRKLKEQNIHAANISVIEKKDKSYEIYMQIKSGDGKCILAREAADYIGHLMKRKFVAAKESRRVVNGNYGRLRLVEDISYQVLYGEARRTKDGEKVSGDCFTVFETDKGKFIAGISDGMGSGVRAKEESERLMEVLEQYLQAGFRKEIAAAMMNTAVLMQENTGFTTMDLCEINLYTGVCEFLKTGAAASFLIRDGSVEMVRSMNLPAGVFHRADYQVTKHQLRDGDRVVMISDGMLEALPFECAEELFAGLLRKYKGSNMGEFADYIMEHTLKMTGGRCSDDMTVLTMGIWQKN